MEENTELKTDCPPEQTDEGCAAEREVTTPEAQPQNITIPVKFNKEIINLELSKAQSLAQKGLKLDAISGELETLRRMAKAQSLSVPQFLSALERQQNERRKEELLKECGGNGELAERILKLEGNSEDSEPELSELQEFFPQIKSVSDLPHQVVERARALGSDLLNEYLRYRETQKRNNREAEASERSAMRASVGSQYGGGAIEGGADAEFIRGLWGK